MDYKYNSITELIDILFPGVVLLASMAAVKKTNSLWAGGLTLISGFALGGYMYWYMKQLRLKRLSESGIDAVDSMTGHQFEEFLLGHFQRQGYNGDTTPPQHDYGADLILEKDGSTIAVQAKRWKKNVGVEAVQQVAASLPHYRADKGIVITTSDFTKNAIKLARSNQVELWNRDKLIDFILKSRTKDAG